MSWETIDVNGKKMYERCDGVRVESNEQIEAIEQQEKEIWEKRSNFDYLDYLNKTFETSDDKIEHQKGSTSTGTISLIILIVFITALVINYIQI